MPLKAAALNALDDEVDAVDGPNGTPAGDQNLRKEGPEIQITLRSKARKMEFRDLHVSPINPPVLLRLIIIYRRHLYLSSSGCQASSSLLQSSHPEQQNSA